MPAGRTAGGRPERRRAGERVRGLSFGPLEICAGTVDTRSRAESRHGRVRTGHGRASAAHYWVEATDDETDTTYVCDLRPPVAVQSHPGRGAGNPWLVTVGTSEETRTAWRSWSREDLSSGQCPGDLTLWHVTLETRAWAESVFGTAGDEDAFDSNCFDLAGHLLEQLTPAWTGTVAGGTRHGDCYVMRGGIRSEAYDPDEGVTMRQIERGGQIHFWVEATTADRTVRYVCDAWSRAPDAYGEPLVTRGRPSNYIPASDGRVWLSAVEHDRHWADPVV